MRGCVGTTQSRHPTHLLPTRSVCLKRCFRRRHLCLRISLEEVLCSVELLSRLVLSSSSESIKLLDSSSLLSTVDALSGGSPSSRRRSPLGCPLVRAAVGTTEWELIVGLQRSQNEGGLYISKLMQ